jgi:outer membrane protein OmpA-like peptidoglycan-associated protein
MVSATGDTDDEQLYRSTDGGQTWSPITAAGWREWSSIAFSDNGNVIVASVGPYYVPAVDYYYSFTNWLYVSTDGGDTWVRKDAVGQALWMAVASDKSGTHLAAVANDGDIWTSANSGSTWVDRDSAGTRNWTNIASSDDGSHLIATTDTGYIYTSADFGANWSVASTPGVHPWRSAAISSNGNYAAAVGKNLEIWTAVPAPVQVPVQSVNAAAPNVAQKSSVKSFSPGSFSEMDATLISIAGSFPEKITAITINGTAAKLGSWSQTSTLVTLNFPPSAVGIYSIKLINGSTPALQEFNVTVVAKKVATPPVVVTPQETNPNSNNSDNNPSTKPLKKTVTERVFFDLGSSLVRGQNLSKLQTLSKLLAGLGNKITIKVTGFAQPTPGSAATDGALSKRRAEAVAKLLRRLGVTTQITYVGAGRASKNVPRSRYVEIVAANS